MKATTAGPTNRPGLIGRVRSRQAGHPSGLLGRVIGRAMVKDTAQANDRSLALLDLSEPRAVLEVGFGQGRTVAKLVEAGHRVLGVEASATMVSQASARNRRACAAGQARLVRSDGVDIPFEDASADAAIVVHAIYFMADPASTFAEIARVLRPDGRIVVACRVGDDEMPAWMDPTVYRIPTVAQIKGLLEAAGFGEVVQHEGDRSTHLTHWFVAEAPG